MVILSPIIRILGVELREKEGEVGEGNKEVESCELDHFIGEGRDEACPKKKKRRGEVIGRGGGRK